MIHSQPIYQPLAWDHDGRVHLLAAHGEGLQCCERLLADVPRAPIAIRYAPAPLDAAHDTTHLASAAPNDFQAFATIATLLEALRTDLLNARMGLRLYLAGSEHFLWSASKIAAEYGLGADEIRREHCGSRARAVYCVHCKGMTLNVGTNVFACSGCARMLMVRDHYSARLAAYMGFQIDAEEPGALPPIASLYA